MKILKQFINKSRHSVNEILPGNLTHKNIYEKYRDFTMISAQYYIDNLALSEKFRNLEGSIVECGVWRGGMIAGIAEILGKNRKYFLCDSFEGLPQAKEIDGQAAIHWQNDKLSPLYFNNCAAEETFAEKAMKMTGVDFKLIKGWFDATLPILNTGPIAILRLDGDWFDSTYCCLQNLYPYVVKGGLIIIDDYYTWDGCSKAVHTYLAETASRIYHTPSGIAYIIKK